MRSFGSAAVAARRVRRPASTGPLCRAYRVEDAAAAASSSRRVLDTPVKRARERFVEPVEPLQPLEPGRGPRAGALGRFEPRAVGQLMQREELASVRRRRLDEATAVPPAALEKNGKVFLLVPREKLAALVRRHRQTDAEQPLACVGAAAAAFEQDLDARERPSGVVTARVRHDSEVVDRLRLDEKLARAPTREQE